MTITTTISRMEYTGNGSTTVFAYSFKIIADSDLKVYLVTAATGAKVLKTLTTHYSVSNAGVNSGGNVTMVTAPSAAEELVIERQVPQTQSVDYIENDAFSANTHEGALDKLAMGIQDNFRDLGRSLSLDKETASSVSAVLPVPAANSFVGWNSSADALINLGAQSSLVGMTAFIGTLVDDADATTARTTLEALSEDLDRDRHATSSGTDTIVVTLSPARTAYAAGDIVTFKAGGTNTGATTINVNALGAKAVQKRGAVLAAGDITENNFVICGYDGTQFQLISPTPDVLSGAVSATTLSATGQVTLSDGTAGAPALSNTGDTNAGIYFPAADTIGVSLAGALDFQFEANDFTALSGSVISTDTIAETTADTGVTIDSLLVKDGGLTAAGAVTVGVDDTGYDVTLFGATAGKKLLWDESEDTLNVAGTTALAGNLSVTGITSNADGAVAAPSITNTGDVNTGIYFPAADTVGITTGGVEQFRFGSNSVSPGSKNLIENGAMNVSQRGAITGQGGTNNVYSALDRWLFRAEGVGQARVSTQISAQSDGNSLIMKGCRNAIEIDCTTAESSVAAGECLMLAQKLEAQNLQHLLFGTSGAKDLTLSFVMKSPKSGTHCVSINQGDANRSYIAEFTMDSANTFQHFSLTIPGDTSGDIDNNNGEGMRLHFPLTAGTTFHNTAGSWFNGEDYATSNQQNLLDNTSNNIYISAVQLEVGGAFTGFEFEDYGTTLNKCWRYFRLQDTTSMRVFGGTYDINANTASGPITFPVEMRAAPTIAFNGTYQTVRSGSVVDTSVGHSASYVGPEWCMFAFTSGSLAENGWYGLMRQSGTCNITYSAEL